jgi:hypothetical protein
MLLLPVALGAGLAGAGLTAAWLVPPAVVLAFLAHHAIVPLVQRRLAGRRVRGERSWRRVGWAALFLLGALALFACTLALTPAPNRSWLIAVSIPATLGAALYTGASMAGEHRRVWIELAGMAAMSLSAPMMGIASGAVSRLTSCCSGRWR